MVGREFVILDEPLRYSPSHSESYGVVFNIAGLNTSDRAIPVSFTVKTSAIHADITALNVRYDVFAMADCIIYIGLDGRMQTRI